MTWFPNPPQIVYIAGKYSARTVFGRIWNIYKAGKAALKYWEKGYVVFCAHMNTALFGELWFHSDKCDYNTWVNGDIAILKRCDVIVMMKGWKDSPGAYREWTVAKRQGMEIIYE